MLPQNTLSHAHKMKLRWLIAVSTLPFLGVVTAFGIMPQTGLDHVGLRTVSEEIVLPLTELKSVAQPASATFWRSERVQRGDTVAELLRRLNVEDAQAVDFLRTDRDAIVLRKLTVGRELQAETAADGSLLALRFLDNDGNQVVIEKHADEFKVRTLQGQLEQRIFVRTGEIQSTLFAATDAAGLPEPAANQMVEIFGGDIDFHRDLRKGDRFTVIYEMIYSNGEPVRTGRILAAEFINHGRTYRASYFQTAENKGDYYSPDGKSMRKAFLRSPIEFSRISSGFTLSRFHPVLNKWRAHRGVDYAAPVGTKVKATADGVVAFVGRQGGYGNVIMINHQGRYTTVYGHLSRFASGLHKGQRVVQGEVIGYVGMTGLASGPHLHYEFRIDGTQRDPLRVALPDAKPVPPELMPAFRQATAELDERLAMLRTTRLASLD